MRRRGQIAYPATKRRGVHHLTVVYVFFFCFFLGWLPQCQRVRAARATVATPLATVAAPRATVAAPVPAAPATVVLWGGSEGKGAYGLSRCVRRSGLLLLARFVYCGMRAVFADGWQWQSPQNVYVEKKGTFKLCRYQHRPSYIMLIESNSY